MADNEDGSFPASITIRSSDLPDVQLPAFYRHIPVDRVIDSHAWDQDSPEGLRERGPRAVGEALTRLALFGQASIFQDVREVAALILDYMANGLHDDPLDLDLGLRRRDGGPSLDLIAKRAERDRLVIGLARKQPFAGMGAWQAADALRKAVKAYETSRWPREEPPERLTAPGDDVGGTAWRIIRLALPQGHMPGQADLRRMIEADRSEAR